MCGAERESMTKRFYLGLFAGLFFILPGCGHEKTLPTPETAAYTKPAATNPAPRLAKKFIYGRIAKIDGDQWTINGIHGNIYTAHISTVTMYGDLFRPQHRNDFRIGDDVRVAGEFVGPAIAATAVEHAVDDD
jgi:hypothetical protein